MLSLSQHVDKPANLAVEEGQLELKDGASGLVGNSLTNMCELTFSTHCSSMVPSKAIEPNESEEQPGKLEVDDYCDQNRKRADPAKESFSQMLKFDEAAREQNT